MMFRWIFIITLLWIGFILAISFMEAPLKFRAPSVTLPIGLEIGHLVFHMLNRIEGLFAIAMIGSLFFGIPSRQTTIATVAVVTVLLVQTALLYTLLDARTLAIINGESVPDAPYHLVYIGLEVFKLALLGVLAYGQLQDFQLNLLSTA